jgi:hypothetical protein
MDSVFLGVIAAATALMAVLQVGAVVVLARLARRLEQSVGQLQRTVQPLIAQATTVSEEAARVATLVSAQVERADVLLGDLARRVDDTVTLVENAIVAPVREGLAIAAGVRAVLSALRGLRGSKGAGVRHEEEDALFIG